MLVKSLFQISLLVFVCAVSAEEVIGNHNEGIISNIKNIADNALQQSEVCNATSPCENGGKCVQQMCSCLQSTSGPLCETIEDCAGSRIDCGDADCLYNVTSLGAYCKCSNATQVFDAISKNCRTCDCGPNGECIFDKNGDKQCDCQPGYGSYKGGCKACRCGPHGHCDITGEGLEGCHCFRGYEYKDGVCVECSCGDHGVCAGTNLFNVKCICDEGYAQEGHTCLECDCGKNGSCYLVGGYKRCSCSPHFQEYRGTCEACDCGNQGSCRIDYYGKKVCTCFSGYEAKSGVCTDIDECLKNDTCPDSTYCINTIGSYDCACKDGYAKPYTSYGKYYNIKLQGCEDCNCGMEEAVNCTITYSSKNCICPEGYEETQLSSMNSTCTDIDECLDSKSCPQYTNCVNTPGSYQCVCQNGFKEQTNVTNFDIKHNGCEDIDECVEVGKPCDDVDAVCVNTLGSYRCDCPDGFTLIHGLSLEKENHCNSDFPPWKTASIVIGCLCAVALLIGIYNRKRLNMCVRGNGPAYNLQMQ